MSKFSIFCPSGQKNFIGLGQKVPGSELGWPLIYFGSKVCSGRVRAHLYSAFLSIFFCMDTKSVCCSIEAECDREVI